MFGVTYQLRLIQPLIVAMLDPGDENAARSLNYVPGSVMRGALAVRYIAENNLVYDTATQDDACRALFFGNDTLFLDCLPVDDAGQRAKPIPLSWFADKQELAEWNRQKKDEGVRIADAALQDKDLRSMQDAKSMSGEAVFCRVVDNSPEARLLTPPRETATHISRPRARKIEDAKANRAVFTYEALAADQLLAGVVLCSTQAGAEKAQKLLQNHADLGIGRSHSAGYGHVRIQAVSSPIPNWTHNHEEENRLVPIGVEEDEDETNWYVITLQSHALLRDDNGQFVTDPYLEIGASNKAARCFLQTENLGGYNRKWGLPTPQAQALRAGSVFAYRAKDVDLARLEQALQNGIGERRNDGLGQIAVNWHSGQVNFASWAESQLPEKQSDALQREEGGEDVHTIILQALLRKMLDQKVTKKANDLAKNIKKPPSKAMLSRVMLAARQGVLARSTQPLKLFLQDVKGESSQTSSSNKPAQKALESSHIGGETLEKWLQTTISECDIQNQLGIREVDMQKSLGGRKAEFNDALKQEYTALLIERVAKRAIKAQTKQKEQAQ